MDGNKNIWAKIISYDVMKLLINLMVINRNSQNLLIENFNVNDKLFTLEIIDNNLIIKCSDGRELCINLFFNENKNRISSFELNDRKTGYVTIVYKFNSELLEFQSEILDNNYESYHNIGKDDLLRKITYYFNDKEYVVFCNGLNEFIYRYHRFCITEDTVQFQYNAKLLVTKDFKRIIKYNDKNIPSLEEIKQFDYKSELEKLNKILVDNELGFHSFSLEYLPLNFRYLEELQNYKEELINAYENSLEYGKEGVNFYNKFISDLGNNLFTNYELFIIYDVLKDFFVEKSNEAKSEKKLVKQTV